MLSKIPVDELTSEYIFASRYVNMTDGLLEARQPCDNKTA